MARRTVLRQIASFTALAMVLAGFEIPAAQASVAPASVAPTSVATVDGFLTTVSSSNPDLLVVNYTVTVQGDSVTAAQLTTTTFTSDPVDPTTVQVDGSTAPSATITQTGAKMTVRLGTGANATDGGSLGVGSYLVSYQQHRPAATTASTSATLAFDRDGTPGSAKSNALALGHPDLTLTTPAGSGEDKAALVGTGRVVGYGAFLRDLGATADDARLTVTVPVGLRVDTTDGVELLNDLNDENDSDSTLACSHPLTATVTCDLGKIAHGSRYLLLIPFIATSRAKVGTRGHFTVSATPNGEPDQHPADNAVSGRVKFAGIARLKATLTSAVTRVPVGSKVTVKVRIQNRGPQPAPMTQGLIITGSRHFAISKFITKRRPASGPFMMRETGPAKIGQLLGWNVGKIGAHSTAYARLILKAKSVGTSRLEFIAESVAGDPSCERLKTCHALTKLKLVAVKKKAAAKADAAARIE